MKREIPSKAAIAGHPIHPMLIPFPIASLVGVLLCDLAFAANGDIFWATAARWLLIVGVVTGLAAGLVGAIDYLGIREVRRFSTANYHALGNVIVLALSVFNLMARWDNAANTQLGLSALTAVILVMTGWWGGELSYHHLVGVNSKSHDTDTTRTHHLN